MAEPGRLRVRELTLRLPSIESDLSKINNNYGMLNPINLNKLPEAGSDIKVVYKNVGLLFLIRINSKIPKLLIC